ncbi:MAG: hypothetical protein J6Z31_00900 [Fibrobacter sp.]|nr:hypothetical protein [Fibrobacter sp.]
MSVRLHTLLVGIFLLTVACSEVNSGWTVTGGGYMNFKINGSEDLDLDIDPDDGDVKLKSNKHYVTFLGKNSDGDALQIMVNKPKLGENAPVTSSGYTYLVLGNSVPAHIINTDSSYVKFDQKDSILWSADVRLVFNHCYGEECDNERVVITGRMRYWVDPDDR